MSIFKLLTLRTVFFLIAISLISGCAATRKLDAVIEQSKSIGEEFAHVGYGFTIYPANFIGKDASGNSLYRVNGIIIGARSLIIKTVNSGANYSDLISEGLSLNATAGLDESRDQRIMHEPNGYFREWAVPEIKLADNEGLVVVSRSEISEEAIIKLSRRENIRGRVIFVVRIYDLSVSYYHLIAGEDFKRNKYGHYFSAVRAVDKLTWERRSNVQSSIMKAGYLLSYPFDIATSPFQLIYYLSRVSLLR